MALIEIKNLKKSYPLGDSQLLILKGISLEISQGEFVAIMGPSGSGKSTLMNILGCLDKPTSGKYFLDGDDIGKQDNDQLATIRNQKIGFVFQSYNLLPKTTSIENVELPLMYNPAISARAREKKAIEALNSVGLHDRLYHKSNQMSGGQQQRVGVARALVVEPEIIFADEPTGNLDSHTSKEVMELMQKVVREQNRTLVMVTHDNELAAYADRVFHIIDGEIVKIEENRTCREDKRNEKV